MFGVVFLVNFVDNCEKMRLLLVFVLICSQYCESNGFDLRCVRFDGFESVELYCPEFKGVVPVDCSALIFLEHISDKLTVKRLKIGGCDSDKVNQILNEFPRLLSLDISHNGIESLGEFKLWHKDLSILNMSHNNLTEVSIGLICLDFPRLEYLDLSNNLISDVWNLPTKLQTNRLHTLRLENNPIDEFGVQFAPLLTNGISVYLSWQNIRKLYAGQILSAIRVLSNSQHEGFLLTNGTVELHCSENGFKNIDEVILRTAIENLTEMMHCLAPSLKRFDLSAKGGESFDSGLFERFINLKRLSLRNTQLTNFDFNDIKNHKHLEWLEIADNGLKIVDNLPFLANLELYAFDAAGNGLENTVEIIYHLKSTVNILRLNGNHLSKLNAASFQQLNHLRILDLRHTNLSFDDFSPFSPLRNLEYLDISDNDLNGVNFASQPTNLDNLLHFFAAKCNISNASELMKQFGQPSKLRRIDLHDNNLTRLDNLNKSRFPELNVLNIANNLFGCEYFLEIFRQFQHDWPHLAFSGFPNDGQEC